MALIRQVQIILWLAVLLATPAWANKPNCEGDCVPVGEWQLSFSLGYGVRTNPVIGQADIPFILVPNLSYYGERFFLENYEVGYTLLDGETHQMNALLFTPGFEQAFFSRWNISNFDLANDAFSASSPPDDKVSDIEMVKLHKRRTAGLSGFEYSYITPKFVWQTQLLQDVTKVHNGQKLRTALSRSWQIRQQKIGVTLGATWQSSKLIDYYYGVRPNEAPSPELAYSAPASTSLYLKAEWEKRINKHWGLRSVTSYRWLGSGVTNSPIIEEDGVFTFYVAGVYHF